MRGIALFGFLLLIVTATRLPFLPNYLYSFDSINLALALDDFNPAKNQPQPPGYPFFVKTSKLVSVLAGSPVRTFSTIKISASCVSVALLFLLVRRMYGRKAGYIAAGLFFTNPVLWYAGLTSALRLFLALFALLVGYFCWRALTGEPRYFYAAGLALGLGSGFRPDLLIFMLPLLLWTAWNCRDSMRVVWGLTALAIGVTLWTMVLVEAYHGPGFLVESIRQYLMEQSQSASAISGSPAYPWRRMIGRAILWNGLGALPWLWMFPFATKRLSGARMQWTFFALWFCPAFLFHSLVHIGDSGHALVSIPALCALGGIVVAEFGNATEKKEIPRPLGILLATFFVLMINAAIFFWPFEIPQRRDGAEFRGWNSVLDAARIGTYETSYARFSYISQTTDRAIREIDSLTSEGNRPVLLIWNRDAEPVWRKIAYYFPSIPIYELVGRRTSSPHARLWKGTNILEEIGGTRRIRLRVPKNGRIIWLLHPDTVSSLKQHVSLGDASPVYFTDLQPESRDFQWGSIDFHVE